MEIKEAILHKIEKDKNTKDDGSVTYEIREGLFEITPVLQQMAEAILLEYGNNVSGYGVLGNDPAVDRFPVEMARYFATPDELPLTAFSAMATKMIGKEMEGAWFATGGFVLFLRYDNLGEDWLLVVMLKLKPGAGIVPGTLDLEATLSFDVRTMTEAARINFGKWQMHAEHYLSFIKKGRADEKVSDYFKNALSCKEYTSATHHTKEVIKALEAFHAASVLAGTSEPEEIVEIKKRVYDYFHQYGKEAKLEAVSARVDEQNPLSFRDFVKEKEYVIGDEFKADRAVYKRLKRISGTAGKSGSVKVSFDVDDLANKRVEYSEATNSLTIKNIGDDLRAEILENTLATAANA